MALQPTQIQPIISKPSAITQRPPILVPVPVLPMWVMISMIVIATISVAALVLTLLRGSPVEVEYAPVPIKGLNITAADTAPVEEGKELQVKISELERNLAQAKNEIQILKEQMLNVSSNVDGMNANLSLVQAQSAKNSIPVNILPRDNDDKK